MKLKTLLFAGASALTMTAMNPAFAQEPQAAEPAAEAEVAAETEIDRAAEAEAPAADPQVLLAEWTGPYGGVPPFDKVDVAMFQPALESAMESARAEITAVVRGSDGTIYAAGVGNRTATPARRTTTPTPTTRSTTTTHP